MPSKKQRAKAARIENPGSAPAIAYKVASVCDGGTAGAVHHAWTHTVVVTASGRFNEAGARVPEKSRRALGKLTTRLVCRNDIRKTFWQSMQEPNGISSEFAFALFDR